MMSDQHCEKIKPRAGLFKLVSIVIPVYNVETLLERCVESVLSQTYSNIQIILVDDGSTDSSGQLCDLLATSDSRIEVLHTENGGLSAARNAGMRLVKGEWVLFVDSDDMIGEEHVENLMNAAMTFESAVVVAITGSTQVSSEDEKIKNAGKGVTESSVLSAADAISISVTEGGLFASHAWGKLYPKELFPLLEYPVGKYFEDQFVTYKVLLHADRIIYENANDYGYTVDRGSSISNASHLHRLDYLEAIRIMRDDLKNKLPEVSSAVSARYYATLASSAAIATLSSDHTLFDSIFAELASVRRDALSATGLSIKTQAVYRLSYLGNRIVRHLLTLFTRHLCS